MSYLAEGPAFAEMSRVLVQYGRAHLVYHGSGYYLCHLVMGRQWKDRFYGLRALVNTWVHAMTGWRLPGFLGDTVYQSRGRLSRHYRARRLAHGKKRQSRSFLGRPVSLYHDFVRPAFSPAHAGNLTPRTARP
jgi:hypothetical protein